MDTQKIIDIWFEINEEEHQNYFQDFIKMYCEDNEIKYDLSITEKEEYLDVRMVHKTELHEKIRKYSNCDSLHYCEWSMKPHNPYQDSIWYLYQSADNAKDYLKKWLFFIVHQKLMTDAEMFGENHKIFEELYYQLIQEYDIGFGNAKYVLPLMQSSYYTKEIKETSIQLILYKFRAEMNYVKANNYFVVFKNEF